MSQSKLLIILYKDMKKKTQRNTQKKMQHK